MNVLFLSIYSVSLFLSLGSHLLWKTRRDRNARLRRDRLIARLRESEVAAPAVTPEPSLTH